MKIKIAIYIDDRFQIAGVDDCILPDDMADSDANIDHPSLLKQSVQALRKMADSLDDIDIEKGD